MPNSAQTKATGPSRPSIWVSGRERSSSSSLASRSTRSPIEPSRAGGLERVRREILELSHRVAAVQLPRERVERAEELGAVGIPRPAIVERDPRERRELGREAATRCGRPARPPRARPARAAMSTRRVVLTAAQASRGVGSPAAPPVVRRRRGSARSSPRCPRRAACGETSPRRGRSPRPPAPPGTAAARRPR